MAVTITLEFLADAALRGNSRAHYMVKHSAAKKLKESGYWHGLIECVDLHLVPKISIRFTFYHWRKIDIDNLAIGMKAWCDGLVQAEVVEDDDPDHVVYEAPEFVRCQKGESRTVVEIKEVPR
jgi:Holliday junction resolvase RusA-like endonuclease